MTAVEWVELGRLGAPYGVKGWLHVESYTEPPERLLDYPVWALRLASGERVHAAARWRGARTAPPWWRSLQGVTGPRRGGALDGRLGGG